MLMMFRRDVTISCGTAGSRCLSQGSADLATAATELLTAAGAPLQEPKQADTPSCATPRPFKNVSCEQQNSHSRVQERQRLQRCLLHTLNNLLQQQAWTVQSLNELCDSIQATRTRLLGNYDANVLAAALEKHGLEVKWHDARDTQLTTLDLTHHNTGTDTQQSGAQEVPPQQQHHQQQQQAYSEDQVEHLTLSERQTNDFQQQQAQQDKEQQQQQELQQELVGLIVNMSGRGWLSSLLGGRHWLAIRWLKGAWWNLDSQLSQPVSFALEELDMGSTAAAAAAAAAATLDASEAAASSIADSTAPAAVPAVTAALSAGDGGAAALKAFLQQQLSSGAHLLLVTRAAAQHDKQWACSS